MRICALDLGTNTGFAVGNDGIVEKVGTWTLATAKQIKEAGKNRMNRRQDPRIPALWEQLSALVPFDWIVFEDVQFSSSTQQTQLWSSFRGVLWTYAHVFGLNIDCLATGKLKLFATGSGSADKGMMARALVRDNPTLFALDKERGVHYFGHEMGKFLTDDSVDATHLLLWAQKTFRNTN